MRLGIQLYTLRDVDDSLTETLHRVAETPYEGVQFAGVEDESIDEIVATLDETGLGVADAHVGLDAIENDYEATRETYSTLGCERLVVPAYEREAFETAAGAREAGERLSDLADRMETDGFEVHYHNHSFEFTDLDGATAFDTFAAAGEGVGLEIDTGLANHAGVDPVALLERYGDRVALVHLTDSDPDDPEAPHADLGTGTVDIEGCVETASEIDAEWLVFEHGVTDDPVASMEDAAKTLAPLL